MKHETKMTFAAAALIVATALTFGCKGGGDGTQQAGGGGEMPPLPVEAAPVVRQKISDDFTAVGTIDGINSVHIVSEIAGKITGLPFDEGASIGKGNVIAQIDDSQLRAERDRAEAIRDQMKISFDRTKAMVDQNLESKQALDNASASFKVSEADLALANAKLDKTRIVAPFGGSIGARQVSLGQYILAGQAIADLAQLDDLKITFSAPERFYSLLHKGAEITVSSPAFPQTLQGKIDIIEPVVSQATRSVNVVAHLRNQNGLFRPGMSANVKAVLNERDSALLIPSQAIITEGNQMSVYIMNADGTVSKTAVQLGSRTSGMVEITSGLSEGQQVITAGYQKFGFLPPGFKVMTMPPGGGQAPAGGEQSAAPSGAAGDSTAKAPAQTDSTKADSAAGGK